MPYKTAPDLSERDFESHTLGDQSRPDGLISCYEARLNATMLQRAMDRERARRPATVKCGRLARTGTAPASIGTIERPAPALRPRMIQVIARSALVTEPA